MHSQLRLILLTLLIPLLIQTVSSSPALDKDVSESDYVGDYANDEDENADGEPYTGPPPKINSQPLELTVKEGDDVLLPCDVENAEKFAVMWKNGSSLLWTDEFRFSKDGRLTKFKNVSLHIRNVRPEDTSIYTCQVSTDPVLLLQHKLNVVSPPTIVRIIPTVHKGQKKIIKKGESLTLSCEVTGYPTPTVVWRRLGHGKRFPSGRDELTGSAITFEEVDRKYSGKYECQASNNINTTSETVEIQVLYAPEVDIQEETVTTTVGHQTEITCTVHAEPKATVTWFKNAKPLHSSEHMLITKIANKHTLQITKIREADFGTYVCEASNAEGKHSKSALLSGKPTKPKVKVDVTDDRRNIELKWTVESYSPILEYDLKYRREDGEEKWVTLSPLVTNSEEGNMYKGKQVLEGLAPTNYQVEIRAKNSYGWSEYSSVPTFSGDSLFDQPLYAVAEPAESTGDAVYVRPFSVILFVFLCSISSLLI